jgi:uncharacterized protein YcfJ
MTTSHRFHTHSRTIALVLSSAVSLTFLSGCQTEAQTGAGLGAGAGAGLGVIIGHQSGQGLEGAAIGAGIGLVSGYLIGNEVDKTRMYRANPATNPRYNPNYDY